MRKPNFVAWEQQKCRPACAYWSVHPHSLISTFVIHLLGSKISKLASGKMAIFSLVSVAEQVGLIPIWFEDHEEASVDIILPSSE